MKEYCMTKYKNFAVLPKTSRGFMCFSIILEACYYSPNEFMLKNLLKWWWHSNCGVSITGRFRCACL